MDKKLLYGKYLENLGQRVFDLWLSNRRIFGTREYFDYLYSQEKNITPQTLLADKSKYLDIALSDPQLLDELARNYAKSIEPPELVKTIHSIARKLGISEQGIDRIWQNVFFSNENLDDRLTEDEKNYTLKVLAIVQYGVKKGYYVSRPADAPRDSKWRHRMEAQAWEEADNTPPIIRH